jgi:bisphosphoglycerate-independent phosphoglycerate mutase (AlkP superfamily)
MSNKAEDFAHLLDLSRTMLAKAQDGLWDEVIALETQRQELIKLFFAEPVHQAHAEAVAAGIKTILALDEKITELAEVKRFDILQLLQTLEQGKKAVKAYTSHVI